MSTHWSDDGLCHGLHSEMFFPPLFVEERNAPESRYYDLGKLVCEQCPIQDVCRDKGADEEYGLWGGFTPKERRTGTYRMTKTWLPVEHHDKLPADDVTASINVAVVRSNIRPFLKRRPRARM